MRRRAHAVHLARRRVGSLLAQLKSTPAKNWPPHLNIAWELLHSGKLALTDEQMLSVIVGSVSAAHACAEAINRRAVNIVEFQARVSVGDAFRRIAKCAKRAPMKLRRRLNEGIMPLIRESPVDLEVIEAIFDSAVSAFEEFRDEEAAKTALREMCGLPPDHDRVVVIKSDYSVLGDTHQRNAEDAIAAIANASNDKTTASAVFNALALAVDSDQSKMVASEIHTLIVDYVAKVATLWHALGLRPSRARHDADPNYTSRFHRFADLVLTARIEPWARRHRISPDDVRGQARLAHTRVDAADRCLSSPAPRRADIKWLVNEDHVKKALRMAAQKTDRNTP
jgi:hypothetical protein